MMKTLLVITSTYPRWKNDHEPSFVHNLNKELCKNFKVIVLCPHYKGAAVEEEMDGVTIQRFRYAPSSWETLVADGGILANLKKNKANFCLIIPYLFFLVCAVVRSVKSIKPDVLHVHWLIPQGLAVRLAAAFCSLPPILLTSHGGDLFGLKGYFFSRLKSWILKIATRVTVVNNDMVPIVRQLGCSVKTQVIPMGVDFDGLFKPIPNCFPSTNIILYVGRLVEKKGVHHLLNAFSHAVRKNPNLQLRVVGYGPDLNKLMLQALNLGIVERVEFVGAVEQARLPIEYNRAALVCGFYVTAESGDRDGFPVSLLEAIACGSPILTSDAEFLLAEFGGAAGEVSCNVKSPEIAAAKILSILAAPDGGRQLAATMRGMFFERYSWSTIGGRYSELINDTAKLHSK